MGLRGVCVVCVLGLAYSRSAWITIYNDQGVAYGEIKWDIDDEDAVDNVRALTGLCDSEEFDISSEACLNIRESLVERADVLRVTALREAETCGDSSSCSDRRRQLFDHVYRNNLWTTDIAGKLFGSLSGVGSANASLFSDTLSRIVRDYEVHSILDVGCGDCTVVASADLTGVEEYIGVDISPIIVEHNDLARTADRLQGRGVSSVRFAALDAVTDELPLGPDLVIVRDVMGHMGPADNLAFLQKLARAEPKLVLMKTYLRTENAYDGDFPLAFGHLLNLFLPPYCAPDPIELHRDDSFDAFVGLWRVAKGEPFATTIDDEGATAWADCAAMSESSENQPPLPFRLIS